MPRFLEKKLMAEYGPGSDIPYKIMNTIGAMHGNKTTAKGERMQAKHDAKVGVDRASGSSRTVTTSRAGHPHRNLGRFLHPKKSR